MAGRAPVYTVNGHLLFDVVSAFQKAVRRGHVDDAVYFAADMDLSGYGNYCWSRLKIIVSEDIGIAEPHLPATIRALYENWQEHRKKKHHHSPERLFLINAVILAATAPKSRIVDHALVLHYIAHERMKREIPDYAYDLHTLKGRRMGRSYTHFFEEGAKLSPYAKDRASNEPEVHLVRNMAYRGEDPYLQPCRDLLEREGLEGLPEQTEQQVAFDPETEG